MVIDETPDTIDGMAHSVEQLRANFLFEPRCETATCGLPPWAEQQFLLAMASLEQAKCFLKMADYFRMRKE